MKEAGVDYIVFSSTAAVYGEPEKTPICEDFPTQPTNVYGRTKLVIEGMLKDYAMAYDMRYVALRYFNAAGASLTADIGEDHHPETHLIPLILKTARVCAISSNFRHGLPDSGRNLPARLHSCGRFGNCPCIGA